MTMAAQSHPPPSEGGAGTEHVPSLMALSRQSVAVSRAPTRERVSEAIALVRARQAAASQKSVLKVQDASELRTLRTSVATNRSNVVSKPDSTRSPLTPAGQTSGMSEKRSHQQKTSTPTKQDNFLLNVFASRSEVATTHSHHDMDSQLSDTPEENAPTYGTGLAFMNPLELVKREFQLATQSASRSEVKTSTKGVTFEPVSVSSAVSRENSIPLDPSLDQSESSDSFDEPVDANTMRDVARFLDQLHSKKEEQSFDQDDSSTDSSEVVVDEKTMEQVNMFLHSLSRKEPMDNHVTLTLASSTSSDPIDAVRKALSDNFIYGSNDDDDSSDGSTNGSVNPETLAEIGAYIDSISQAPLVKASDEPMQPQDAPTYANPETFEPSNNKRNAPAVALEHEEHLSIDELSQSLPKVHEDAPTFANPETFDVDEHGRALPAFDDEPALLQTVSSDSNNIGTVVQQTRVSKPSPIYEQVEAKSLTRGAHKDPPSVLTTRNQDQVDPPAPTGNWNEAVMRMHEAQTMAPSYSAESLESSSIVLDQHAHVIDEKKMEESHDQELVVNSDASGVPGFEQSSTPVRKGASTEPHGSEDEISDDLAPEGGKMDRAAVSINDQFSADGSDTDDEKDIHLLGRFDIDDTERSTGSGEQLEDDYHSEEFDELVDDAGVPVRTHLSGDESDMHDGKASQLVGRYDIIEAEQSHESADAERDDDTHASEASDTVSALPNINMRDLPNSPSMKDDNSIPWELKDIASEETMKAGRKTRTAALIPASRSKARKLTSLLSDDSSVPQSSVMDSDHGSEFDDVVIGAPKSDNDKLAHSDDEHGPQACDDAKNEVKQSNLTFDDCIIEEGEDGVEVLGNSYEEENTSEDVCDGADELIDDTNVYVDIPANPSGEQQPHPGLDPSGCLPVDTAVAAVTKPDPDISGEPSNVTLSEMNRQNSFDKLEARNQFLDRPDDTINSATRGKDEGSRISRERLETTTHPQDDTPIEDFAGFPAESPVTLSPQSRFTFNGIVEFFNSLHQTRNDDSQPSAKHVKHFQRVVAPFVAGKKPTEIETAQIRQAAQNAEVPLDLVDRFLEYVIEDKAQIAPTVSSISENVTDEDLINKMEAIEDVNEDEVMGDFLTRFTELQREGHFSDTTVDALQDENNETNSSVLNQGFMDDDEPQTESVGLESESNPLAKADHILDDNNDHYADSNESPIPSVPQNLFTLAGIIKFFENLGKNHKDASDPMAQNVKFFQRLVAPIIDGRKPTIIETAQIRQAAQRAQVPIEVVDRFLDYVNEDKTPIPAVFSSTSEYAADDESFNETGDIGYANEDEAIGAFLTRFGELHRGGHFPDANIDAVKDYIQQDTGSAEEAVEIDAEYGYVKKSMVMPTLQVEDNTGNDSVLNQGFFDEFEPQSVISGLSSVNPSETAVTTPRQNLSTFAGIVEFFDFLHQTHKDESQPLAQHVKFFQRLVAPFVAGKRPTIIEAAQIRQAAQRAQVPIEVVDRFLDYVTEDKTTIPTILSSNSEYVSDDLFHEMEEIEDVNEDDAIGAFLTRFGELHRGGHFPDANIDAVKNYIQLDSGSGEEAVEIDAEYGYVKKSMMMPMYTEEDNDSNRLGFLEQYDSLEMEKDTSQVEKSHIEGDSDGHPIENPDSVARQNLFTLPGIIKFFETLDQQNNDANEPLAQNIKFFQRLVAPIIEGRKPTIIETAQIRQAAQRAQVPIEVVDRFLDYVNEDKTPIPAVMSSNSEFIPDEKFEEIEDLNEDEAIGAFLTRFGALHRGGHFPDADVEAVEKYIQPDPGSGEEAVEVDAEYGFVKKEMMIQVIDDDDDDVEWWKEGQQSTKSAQPTQATTSFETEEKTSGRENNLLQQGNDEVVGKKGILVTTEDSHEQPLTPPSRPSRRQKEPALIVNTRYSNFFVNDEEWTQRKKMATFGAGWESHAKWLSPRSSAQLTKPRPIDGVAAAGTIRRFLFSKRLFKNHQPWKRLYKERTQHHPGFLHVDVNSIYDSTVAHLSGPTEEEYIPWEHREVQQRFLHETSYSFSRNWFGDLVRKRGNQKMKMPVCKPKSMEMPIESVPQAGEWTKEWFTQWKSPYNRYSRSSMQSRSDDYTDASYTVDRNDSDKDTYTDGDTYTDREYTDHGSYTDGSSLRRGYDQSSYSGSADSERTDESSSSEGSATWEEAPECGQIINVRQKIGERVTRVHPDYTSSLRRSRWRKKYFPRGTFPY